MNNRRRTILNELGLLPVWHFRSNNPTNIPAQDNDNTALLNKYAKNDQTQGKPHKSRRQKILHMDWDQLRVEVTNCAACTLNQTRTLAVFGTGDQNANWLCVGEGPGAREDATGEPFVGPAGKLLDNMLSAIGLKRGNNVYIANIVKCRPPNNRNPGPDEIRQCEPFLTKQIELIQPKIILALGKVAAHSMLDCDNNTSISSLRGKMHRYTGIPLIVTYHPAYLLRALPEKAKAWEDLCLAMNIMQSLD